MDLISWGLKALILNFMHRTVSQKWMGLLIFVALRT